MGNKVEDPELEFKRDLLKLANRAVTALEMLADEATQRRVIERRTAENRGRWLLNKLVLARAERKSAERAWDMTDPNRFPQNNERRRARMEKAIANAEQLEREWAEYRFAWPELADTLESAVANARCSDDDE